MAAGLFLAALHRMGLATLTHSPNPMRFLSRVLDRPHRVVPDLRRKSLDQVMVGD